MMEDDWEMLDSDKLRGLGEGKQKGKLQNKCLRICSDYQVVQVHSVMESTIQHQLLMNEFSNPAHLHLCLTIDNSH